MLNRCVLIGRLVADPELRYTQTGIAVTNFRIAVDRPFTNQQGERQTDFIDIVCWRKLAEIAANNLGKGRLVAVDGRLQINQWQDQDGNRRSKPEIQADDVRFLDRPRDGQAPSEMGPAKDSSGGGEEVDFNTDDVPF